MKTPDIQTLLDELKNGQDERTMKLQAIGAYIRQLEQENEAMRDEMAKHWECPECKSVLSSLHS